MDREQIVKALEYCASGGSCNKCPYDDNPRLSFEGCLLRKMTDALALIKELTEDNEWSAKRIIDADKEIARLRASSIDYRNIPDIKADVKADTVRKMRESIKALFAPDDEVQGEIDRIAEELINGAN